MAKPQTVIDLLERGATADAAIGAIGRRALDLGGLRVLCRRTIADLNARGIGRNERVAIVLPNGPEMAAVFIAVAAGATTAPLNPAYHVDEFDFYLSDLKAKALIVGRGMESPAIEVARRHGIEILELAFDAADPVGSFAFVGSEEGSGPGAAQFAEADDMALILHTSGTTSRPKMVPLSQRNICASARNIAATLALNETDKCLNIMPLFHIHGLIAAVLASLSAGASVTCSPGFNALRMFAWLDEVAPSWYSAVPTMHQAILARSGRNADSVARANLRFIRSSSSSLPPQVMAELEQVFSAPVIESYGMTEASHQMASNQLPPGQRKPGSVGCAAGPEIAIMAEHGSDLLPQGATGEIVIRGDNVTAGYLDNPEANSSAFDGGWFRTGDQGRLDDDGFLALTGRLKEIINRGGEKISPREVDEVLMDHPAVAQAVTFALPHDKLGEDVAAAIVLKEGESAAERELKDIASERLADFKVPRKLLIVEEIPKGATGKLQRIGLAQKLGLAP